MQAVDGKTARVVRRLARDNRPARVADGGDRTGKRVAELCRNDAFEGRQNQEERKKGRDRLLLGPAVTRRARVR